MKRVSEELPEYSYMYLGDNARAPYGSRSHEVVYNFTREAVEFLFSQGCSLVILACNTASSHALKRIQKEYLPFYHPEKRVLGVIIPTVEDIIESNSAKRVGVMATEGTVSSNAYNIEIKKVDPHIEVFQKACPLLVPILESGEKNSKVTEIVLRKYLEPLLKKRIDSLVLGCTHYGLLEDKIEEVLRGKGIRVVVEDRIVASKLKDYLKRHPEIEQRLRRRPEIKFFSTDLTEKFTLLGSDFFGKSIKVQKISF